LPKLSRREFVKIASAATTGVIISSVFDWSTLALQALEPISIENPLDFYPSRTWEEVYRDQYSFDSTFTFVCAPNDTHNCRLRAYVKNGIIVRIEQSYGEHRATDLQKSSIAPIWEPRGCLKGYTLMRRFYSPHRLRYPMVRKGWQEWARAGFPAGEDGKVPEQYLKRGEDEYVRVSWEEALTLSAQGLMHIAGKYSGEKGADLLQKQGYPEEMIRAMNGAGTQVLKFRPGMGLLGITRIMAMVRFANMLQLLDVKFRNVGPEDALGARYWSNYTWHGDLDPGTPMVTGVQTWDMDVNDWRYAKLHIQVGKNLIENKMPEAHWFVELMERGGKVIVITPEYSPTATKADYWVSIRPGSDVALFLGIANVIMKEKKYDETFVKRFTDLPLLVRGDNLRLLRASDVIPAYKNKNLKNWTLVEHFDHKEEAIEVQRLAIKTGELSKWGMIIDPVMRESWGDFVVWDKKSNGPKVVTRDDVGENFDKLGIDPVIEGTFKVRTVDGKEVEVKPLFQLYREITDEYDPDSVTEITGISKELVVKLANDISEARPGFDPKRPHLPGGTEIHTGEGVNHYFHCDQKDRVIHLVLALTANWGKPGANKGHWAGNYKHAVFGIGMYSYVQEDPWKPALDANTDGLEVPLKIKAVKEEVCYWNYNDRPLVVETPKSGRKVFTGKTHMPTPTKCMWYANVNLVNNAKWFYQMVRNVQKNVEMVVVQNWEFAPDCDFADIVFPVHSWAEMTQPDMTASCSNPFLQIWKGGIKPIYDTKMDSEVVAGVAAKLSEITGDERFKNYWKFILEGKAEVYIQRVLDACQTTRGYKVQEILNSDREWLMMFRTYPRIPGWEQINESKPFFTKTGRLEFYREEDEFLNCGENFTIFREQTEATPYLNNVIVSSHPWIRPEDYGIPQDSTDLEAIQVRNIKMPWRQVKNTQNFLVKEGYKFYCLTPKSRHTVHASWSNSDWNRIWANNFGDPLRMDKRSPEVGEHQMHMNPDDAKELGISDGDYAYVDANSRDRPYVGWINEKDPLWKKTARLMVRIKYNPAYPRGVVMMKHSSYAATPKTVRSHETRPDGLAVSESPGGLYFANFRYGSQQSVTRAWLQPTMMTDSLVRKDNWGWTIGKGFEIDVHAPNTVPKEVLVKIQKAEDGGMGGKGVWEPAKTGFTPNNESEEMKRYLKGGFIEVK
jgi:nitrate reductase alpha subunit